MNDDRSIINQLSRLIVAFDLFRDKHDDFEFKKNSSLELESRSFEERSQHENIKNDVVFMNVYANAI